MDPVTLTLIALDVTIADVRNHLDSGDVPPAEVELLARVAEDALKILRCSAPAATLTAR